MTPSNTLHIGETNEVTACKSEQVFACDKSLNMVLLLTECWWIHAAEEDLNAEVELIKLSMNFTTFPPIPAQ